MHGSRVGLGTLLICAGCSVRSPQLGAAGGKSKIGDCRIPTGVRAVADQGAMPDALKSAVKERFGEIVDSGRPFDATDLVRTGRNRRLIFIWVRENTWLIATEHGGRGYNDPVLVYSLSDDGKRAGLVTERTAFPESVCSVAVDLLNPSSSDPALR
jgi:hypothetical protein